MNDKASQRSSRYHPIFRQQLRMIRGIRNRWKLLQRARSVDTSILVEKKTAEQQRYSDLRKSLVSHHEQSLQNAITTWDSEIDQQLGTAERETLSTLNREQQLLAQLKSAYQQNKASERKRFEVSSKELKQKLDEGKAEATKVKENVKAKLDHERIQTDNAMHETREWINIKTNHSGLEAYQSINPPSNLDEIRAITDLAQIAKLVEERKKSLLQSIVRLRHHPATRLLGPIWFGMFGALVAAGVGYGLYRFGQTPFIWSVFGVATWIVVSFGTSLLTAPFIARTLRRLFPPVVEQETELAAILLQGKRIAEIYCQNECLKLDQKFASDLDELKTKHEKRMEQLKSELESKTAEAKSLSKTRRVSISSNRKTRFAAIVGDHQPKIENLKSTQKQERARAEQEHRGTLKGLDDAFESAQAFAVNRWKNAIRESTSRMNVQRERNTQLFPEWQSEPIQSGQWNRSPDSLAWPLGNLRPAVEIDANHVDREGLEPFASDVSSLDPWPLHFDLLDHGALVVESDAATRSAADQVVRNVLLRAITSLPAGSLHTTIIDPEGLGKQFAWLMSLSDVDPALVNHRVWTQPVHIADQLAQAARHVEDVIQQSLRNNYTNLLEYNRDAGPMAVPFRLIVWAGFPFGLDDHSWQSLCAILSAGGRCGVGVIIQYANNIVWPSFASREKLREYGLHLQMNANGVASGATGAVATTISIAHPELSNFQVSLADTPDEPTLSHIMDSQLEAATNIGKVVVPFESIAPQADEVQKSVTSGGLEIPIGLSDSGRIQCLRLGSGTSQHVLIAGKTGSGKSSLLHTLISSAALKYSPDQLRLVLLDFKKGVEFQVYSELELSHTDIIGIESKREFGLSTLEYMDRVMTARGEAFREWGVQDLPSLARKFPNIVMPRILIVIDEFQEMFVEDDKISQQASMLMDRIVRQGRSFGMHLVLASQTLGGAYSLPRTTLSQMAVRIALQCDSSDAMLILSEDNSGAERLRHSGQAIYNESGGRIESNQNFQVSYLEKNDQLGRLGVLPSVPVPHSPTTNALGRRIVFEGHKPATWDDRSVDLAIQSQPKLDEGTFPWILGDSVSIDPPVIKNMTRAAGRNVMVVGPDDATVAGVLAGLFAGWKKSNQQNMKSSSETLAPFLVLDGTRQEDLKIRSLLGQMKDTQIPVQIGSTREIDSMTKALSEELERRNANPAETFASVQFIVLNLSRFRELRRSEEFSFGTEEGGVKPDAVLSKLLTDGPSVGIHCWIWADSAGTLGRWLSRQSIRDIELRVLMQMSSSDSNQLIDSNAANRLERNVVLLHDDIEGKAVKFRPYDIQSMDSALK